jgi:hypothetical protein
VIEVQREAVELFYVVRITRLDRIERLTGVLGPRAGIRSNLWSLGARPVENPGVMNAVDNT